MTQVDEPRMGDVRALARLTRKLHIPDIVEPSVAGSVAPSVLKKRLLIAGFCKLIGEQMVEGKAPPLADRPLSPRERQTLQLLLAGDAEKQIAAKLSLSKHTVHVYVKSLYKRFDVSSRGELLARWVKR